MYAVSKSEISTAENVGLSKLEICAAEDTCQSR